jgi:small subunit ribosomal protein S17
MKTVTGTVISNKMQKTVVVEQVRLVAHPIYHKQSRKNTKYHAHDEVGAKIGDTVELVACRPISKTKAWNVKRIVKTYGAT